MYEWITSAAIKVVTEENGYVWKVEKLNHAETATLSYDSDGFLNVNGAYYDFGDDFMCVVGMLDAADETTQGTAVFIGEAEMYS